MTKPASKTGPAQLFYSMTKNCV